jgi:hypothetical protein
MQRLRQLCMKPWQRSTTSDGQGHALLHSGRHVPLLPRNSLPKESKPPQGQRSQGCPLPLH